MHHTVSPFLRCSALRLLLPGAFLAAASQCGPSTESAGAAATGGGDRRRAASLVQQAEALQAQGRPGQARALLDQAIALDPSWTEACWLRGRLLSRLGVAGDLSQALEDVERSRRDRPEDLDRLAEEARVRDQLGQARPTVDLLEDFLVRSEGQQSRQDQRTWARTVLGRLLLREEDHVGAERHLRLVEDEGQGGPESALGLARVARAKGDAEEWERWLELSLRRAPLNLQARRERQQLLQRTGRPDEAAREKDIQELLRVLVQDSSTRLGEDLATQARLWGALAELLPEVTNCRVQQVRLLDQAGLHEELRRLGPAILEQGLRHVDVIGLVALAQARGGQVAEALRTAELLKECTPTLPPQYLNGLRRQIRDLEREG